MLHNMLAPQAAQDRAGGKERGGGPYCGLDVGPKGRRTMTQAGGGALRTTLPVEFATGRIRNSNWQGLLACGGG